MEDVVDSPCRGELESERHRRDRLDDLEGPLAFWSQLDRLVRQLQVGAFQPDHLTFSELIRDRDVGFGGLIDGCHSLGAFLEHVLHARLGRLVV